MVRRRAVVKSPKKEEIPIDPREMCCKNCIHSYLMRTEIWNPIVAECVKTKERHVATTPQNKRCGFEKRKDAEIVIHKMIFLK